MSMRRARIAAVAAAIGLLLAGPAMTGPVLVGPVLVGPVMIGPGPASAADGLGQFQDMLRQGPHGVLSYERGKALGDDGFVLENVTVKPPPEASERMATEGLKAEPIHIDRIAVEAFDFASYYKDETPNFAKLHAEGIAIDTKSFDAFDLRDLTGLGTIMADFRLDYRVDPERKTMNSEPARTRSARACPDRAVAGAGRDKPRLTGTRRRLRQHCATPASCSRTAHCSARRCRAPPRRAASTPRRSPRSPKPCSTVCARERRAPRDPRTGDGGNGRARRDSPPMSTITRIRRGRCGSR